MTVSEVAQLRQQIADEYLAAQSGLTGLASGTSRHQFITARLENLGVIHERLIELVGSDEAIKIVATSNLRQRITSYADSGKEMEPFPLTFGELSIIDSAIKNFVAHLFPQSQERDETIGAYEGLRVYISSSFALVRREGEG